MKKKTLLISTVLSGVLLFLAVGVFFAGTSELLLQADTYREQGQYEQAEAIYLQIVTGYPGTDYAFKAQKNLAILYVLWDKQPEADAAFGQLVTYFSKHTGITEAIWQVAKEYQQRKKNDKALELHQYNVQKFTPDKHAMWSQVEIIYSLIDSGDAAAGAACDKLITVFSEQDTLPKEIHQVAMRYSGSGQSEKAYSLHQYNVEHFPDYNGLDVIWSQSELIRLDLQAGFYELAYAGVEDLLGWPPDQNDLPREIHVTAKRFADAGKHEKANELYQYNIEHFPKDLYAMWSQVEITYAHINGGDFAAADEACDKLLSLFSKQESLPKEVYQVAEVYNKTNRSDKAAELCQYIVKTWPSSDHALLAQKDLTIWSIDTDDELAAQAAVDKLLSDFSKHQGISQVIHAVAQHYERVKDNQEKALELYRHNVGHFSSDMYAMWSQVEIVKSYIRDGNDTDTNEAFDKLVTLFAEQPTLPKEIYQVGDEYARTLNYDKAEALYQYVIAKWTDTEHEMWARTGVVKLDIYCGNDANAQSALDQLIADFNDQPELPQALLTISEQYFYRHNYQRATELWELMLSKYPESSVIVEILYALATSYERLKDDPNAIKYFTKLIEQYPNGPYAYRAPYKMALIYRRQKQYDKAIYWFQQQRQLYSREPYGDRALYCEGLIYLNKLKEYQKAADIFQEYIETYPNRERHLAPYRLAICYEQMGKKAQAIELLQQGLVEYSDTVYAETYMEKLMQLQ